MLSTNLKEARIKSGLTQEDLASLLGKSKNVISNWERGDNKPDADTIFKLCDILNVDANYLLGWTDNKNFALSISEQQHIKKYRALDEHGKKVTDMLLDAEYNRCTTVREPEPVYGGYSYCIKPSYRSNLSAGTGLYVFDDLPTEQIEVPIEYDYIDFVIGVSGNSMWPNYEDGDKVMIVKQPKINIGEIGAFMVNGQAYIKELGSDRLISQNKEYDDIIFSEDMRIDCIGKVVGKL